MKSLLKVVLPACVSSALTVFIVIGLFSLNVPKAEAVYTQEPILLPFYYNHNSLAMERLSRSIHLQLDLLEEAQYDHLMKLRLLNQEVKLINENSK